MTEQHKGVRGGRVRDATRDQLRAVVRQRPADLRRVVGRWLVDRPGDGSAGDGEGDRSRAIGAVVGTSEGARGEVLGQDVDGIVVFRAARLDVVAVPQAADVEELAACTAGEAAAARDLAGLCDGVRLGSRPPALYRTAIDRAHDIS